MKKNPNKYPKGWNEKRINALARHYEEQTEDEEVAEDEKAFNDPEQTMVLVPRALLPKVNKLLLAHRAQKSSSVGARPANPRKAASRRPRRRAHAA